MDNRIDISNFPEDFVVDESGALDNLSAWGDDDDVNSQPADNVNDVNQQNNYSTTAAKVHDTGGGTNDTQAQPNSPTNNMSVPISVGGGVNSGGLLYNPSDSNHLPQHVHAQAWQMVQNRNNPVAVASAGIAGNSNVPTSTVDTAKIRPSSSPGRNMATPALTNQNEKDIHIMTGMVTTLDPSTGVESQSNKNEQIIHNNASMPVTDVDAVQTSCTTKAGRFHSNAAAAPANTSRGEEPQANKNEQILHNNAAMTVTDASSAMKFGGFHSNVIANSHNLSSISLPGKTNFAQSNFSGNYQNLQSVSNSNQHPHPPAFLATMTTGTGNAHACMTNATTDFGSINFPLHIGVPLSGPLTTGGDGVVNGMAMSGSNTATGLSSTMNAAGPGGVAMTGVPPYFYPNPTAVNAGVMNGPGSAHRMSTQTEGTTPNLSNMPPANSAGCQQQSTSQSSQTSSESSLSASSSKAVLEQEQEKNKGKDNNAPKPPFYLFDAPCELRLNFLSSQKQQQQQAVASQHHNISVSSTNSNPIWEGNKLMNDANGYHYGMAVNGFHPQLSMPNPVSVTPFHNPYGASAHNPLMGVGMQPNVPTPIMSAQGVCSSPHLTTGPVGISVDGVKLMDARHAKCRAKEKLLKERNEREQRRAQKITELIDSLRLSMVQGGWKIEMKSKYHTLSTCADYVKHLIKLNKDKEALVQKAKSDLKEFEIRKQQLLSNSEEGNTVESSSSDPESIISSLTADTTRTLNSTEFEGDLSQKSFQSSDSRRRNSSSDLHHRRHEKRHMDEDNDGSNQDESGKKRKGNDIPLGITQIKHTLGEGAKESQDKEIEKPSPTNEGKDAQGNTGNTVKDHTDKVVKKEEESDTQSPNREDCQRDVTRESCTPHVNVGDLNEENVQKQQSEISEQIKDQSHAKKPRKTDEDGCCIFDEADDNVSNMAICETATPSHQIQKSADTLLEKVEIVRQLKLRTQHRGKNRDGHHHAYNSHSSTHYHKKKRTSLTNKKGGSELDYQQVFQTSNVPQLIATATGRIVTWNNFFHKVTNLNDEEIQRLTIFSLVKADHLSNLFEIVAKALRHSSFTPESCSSDRHSSGSCCTDKDDTITDESMESITTTSSSSKSSRMRRRNGRPSRRIKDYATVTLPCIQFKPVTNDGSGSQYPTPMYMTVTLIDDKNPKKRCFHCALTDGPGKNGSLGSISTKLLHRVFSEFPSSSTISNRRKEEFVMIGDGEGNSYNSEEGESKAI